MASFLPIMIIMLSVVGTRITWPYLFLQGIFSILFLVYDYVMIRLIIRFSQLEKN